MPPREPDHRVRKETAEHLLRNLIKEENPGRTNAIYILAVMLERQRVFVEREARRTGDGRRLVIYEHKRTGETFAVTDPELRLAEVDPVQQEIMALLAGDKTCPGMADMAPPTPSPHSDV